MQASGQLVLSILRSRGVLLLGVVGFCVIAAVAYSALTPDRYRAVATLLIDPSPFDTRSAGGGQGTAMGSEVDLLRSERVAQRVVENERLVEEPALRNLYLQSIDAGRPPLEALAQYVAHNIRATGSDDGGLVTLAVTMADPALAARVANAYAQAWGEVSLELRANSIRSGVERAHGELVALRARLGAARSRLSGGAALAAADGKADEQFAQLSRLSTRPLAQTGTVALPETMSSAGGGIHNVAVTLAGEPLAAARLDPIMSSAAAASAVPGVTTNAPASSADDEIRIAQQSLERAEDRLARLAAEGIGAPFPAHVLRAARVPDASTKPGLAICAAFGLLAGLIFGVIAMLLGELLDRRVRRPSDLTRMTGIVVLGNLPAVVPAKTPAPQASALRLQRAGNGAY